MDKKPGLLLTYIQLNELINYAKTSPDKEICGAILGNVIDKDNGLYKMVNFVPIKNVAGEGVADYVMDPNELFNKVLKHSKIHFDPTAPLSFVGVFHNHPYWRPYPSEMDIEGAGYAGIYVIYSNLYNDIIAWYNEGSDDSNISSATNNGNRGFGNAYLYIR